MCSVTRIRRHLRHLPQLRRVLPQLRRALLSPSFILGQRWAHHRIRLVVSFPFCRLASCFVNRSSANLTGPFSVLFWPTASFFLTGPAGSASPRVAPPPLLGAQPPGTTCPRRAARAAYRAEPAPAEPDLLCVAAGQPSAAVQKSGHCCLSPTPVSTLLRSPRSPLSVPQSTQAPSHPKPRQLDAPWSSGTTTTSCSFLNRGRRRLSYFVIRSVCFF
jgi:hypothetical protein